MKKERRCYFTVVKNGATLSTEMGTKEIILLVVGAILFLFIGSIP